MHCEVPMAHYHHHVFFCTNQREKGASCCNNFAAQSIRDYAKARIKALGVSGAGQIRVNQAGCLGRCAEGPVLVVYPEGIWYTYSTRQDIDAIIERHLMQGEPVQDLII